MKKFLLTPLILLVAFAATAQERDTSYWTLKGVAGLTASQVSLSNWAAGGDNSVAGDITLNYSADYKKAKHMWHNQLELAYGLNNTSSNGTRKTNDKIYISSTYGYKIAEAWYLSFNATFNTQFAKGYDYSVNKHNYISRFLSPGYLTAGPGITWTPKSWFTATISPASWRGTFMLDDSLSWAGAYGVTPGKYVLSEFGANFTAELKYEIMENMLLSSRLNLFSNYLEKAQNVDVRWDTQLNMKINKWFSATFAVNMIYDDDVKIPDKDGNSGPRLQIKQSLGIGFMANF